MLFLSQRKVSHSTKVPARKWTDHSLQLFRRHEKCFGNFGLSFGSKLIYQLVQLDLAVKIISVATRGKTGWIGSRRYPMGGPSSRWFGDRFTGA